MKGISTKAKARGLTLVEVLVVLGMVAIVLAILLRPSTTNQSKAASINCVGYLKQIGLGLGIYAEDNDGKYPFQIYSTNGGALEFIQSSHVFPHYQKAASELGTPKVLICPFETKRYAATSFETLTDSNISYFLNVDAKRDSPANSIVSGDRFLENNGQPVKSGLFVLTTNLNMSWTPSVHKGSGNVLWTDGSVQQSPKYGLPALIQSQPLATNRLLIP